jgi:signal transduction histidine kinase
MEIFNYYPLSLCIGAAVSVLSGAYVFFDDSNTNRGMRYAWGLYALAAALWSAGYAVMILSVDASVAWYADWILHVAAILIPIAYLWTVLELTGTVALYTSARRIFTACAALFLLASPTHYFVVSVTPKYLFNFVPTAGPLYPAFTLYFFVTVVYALYILVRGLQERERGEALRLWYVLVASVVGFTGGASVFFLTYNIMIPPYPIALFAAYPIVISYAILRHGLFSVRIVMAEVLSGLVLTILFFKLVLVTDVKSGLTEMVFLAIVAALIMRVIQNVRSEVKKREEAEEASREKSELLAFATHELRSPVTAMRGYASVIVDGTTGEVNPETMRVSRAILESGDNVLGLINRYLTRAKLELGHTEYYIDRVDVAPIVAAVAEAQSFNAKLKGLTITADIDRGHQYFVRADVPKLKEVVTNVVDNAVKYTKEGGVTLSVARSGVHVRITVTDTGNGIAPDALTNLFKKFSRADIRRSNAQGSGIGLYLAKPFIEGMGARIWAESEGEGKGSRFIIEFAGA